MKYKYKFKKGDHVLVTGGKDKGKKGKIEKILPKNNSVFLPGLNIYKKHLKKKDENSKGGIVEFSRPIPIANIALLCPKCTKTTRIGFELKGQDKIRICRKCKARI